MTLCVAIFRHDDLAEVGLTYYHATIFSALFAHKERPDDALDAARLGGTSLTVDAPRFV